MRLSNRTLGNSPKESVQKSNQANPDEEEQDSVKRSASASKRQTEKSMKVTDVSGNVPSNSAESSSRLTVFNENQCELNHHVLGHIYSFLDLEALRNCRLISKTWNEEASRQLGNKYWFKINWQKIYLKCDENRRFSPSAEKQTKLSDNEREQKGKEETHNLLECLSSLSNPVVFANFEFDFEWLLNEEFQELLEKYGPTLKRIIIRDKREFDNDEEIDVQYSKRMEIVYKILSNWCPNLITYQMEVVRKTDILTRPMQIKWLEPNNIRELSMEGVLTEYQSEFWIQLIKSSPCLTSLSISCIPDRKRRSKNPAETLICESFFSHLSKLPEVTKKFEKFSWNGTCERLWYTSPVTYGNTDETSCNILQFVSKMEFSNKLKRIGFGPSINCLNDRKEQYLSLLLTKLNRCGTQEIDLNGRYWKPLPPGQVRNYNDEYDDSDEDGNEHSSSETEDEDGSEHSSSETEDEDYPCDGCEEDKHTLKCFAKIDHIPQMTKVTSIESFAVCNYEMGAFHFLHKFPNLKMYSMNQDSMHKRYYNLDPELHYMCEFPHYNLRTLILSPRAEYSGVEKPQTLECLIKSFPNLISLHIEVGGLHRGYRRPKIEISFNEALSVLSKCEHLKELALSYLSPYSPPDLSKVLGVVKNFAKLEVLKLHGCDCSPAVSFKNIKQGLSQLRNLTTFVDLVGYKVTEHDTIGMEKFCDKNRIRAKFITDTQKKFSPGDYLI